MVYSLVERIPIINLCADTIQCTSKKPEKRHRSISFVVGAEGLEPSLTYCERDFESSASTDSATPPHVQVIALNYYPFMVRTARKMLLFFEIQ